MKLTRPLTSTEEVSAVARVLESETLTQGPAVARFERLVADRVGTEHAFATSSCTTALHLSLAAYGIGPGDEVAISDFTYPATGNVVAQQGATPVLVDIDLPQMTMSPSDLEAKISPRTKGVIVVHAFGTSADMDPISALCSERGIPLIEDAATALGSTYRGRYCGSIGDVGCFSFHPRKVITTGEGGMITTDNQSVAETLERLRTHGARRGDRWLEFTDIGYNYRLSDVLGAIGEIQMSRLDEIIESRRRRASAISNMLSDLDQLILPADPVWGSSTFQSYVVLCNSEATRDRLLEHLNGNEIEATLGTYALHLQDSFRALADGLGDLPQSARAYTHSLTLPLFPQMTDSEIEQLSDAVHNGLA